MHSNDVLSCDAFNIYQLRELDADPTRIAADQGLISKD
ncbi:hypothetical protein SAMD00079811_26530 [Scytonema sp. HK-05]|nr:hypothetical protein SAMD00079811_26530 [Scytonema sp. HK-05]